MDKVGEYTLAVMKKAKWYNTWILSFFGKYLEGEILEVGSGTGNFSSLLKSYGKLSAVDIKRNYFRKYNDPQISVGYGDIEKGQYFFKNKKFDAIVCINVIEHIKNDTVAIKNIHKLLKSGGAVVALVPAGDLLYSDYDRLLGHYRRYTVSSFRKKFQSAGFKIKSSRYLNWWGAVGWFVYLKLLRKSVFPKNEVGIFDFFGRFFLWPEKIFCFPFGLSVLLVAEK